MLHAGLSDRARTLVVRRNELQMAIAEDVGTEDSKWILEANYQVWDGLVAAYAGDAEAASEHARKMEGAHWVLGTSALTACDHAKALEHLRQANHANNMFVRYQLARATWRRPGSSFPRWGA